MHKLIYERTARISKEVFEDPETFNRIFRKLFKSMFNQIQPAYSNLFDLEVTLENNADTGFKNIITVSCTFDCMLLKESLKND